MTEGRDSQFAIKYQQIIMYTFLCNYIFIQLIFLLTNENKLSHDFLICYISGERERERERGQVRLFFIFKREIYICFVNQFQSGFYS